MHIVFTIADEGAVPYFKWFAEKAKQANKHTFSFVALSLKSTKMLESLKRLGFDTFWIKFDTKNRKKSMFFAFFSAYKLLKKLKPDVVQTNLFDDSLPVLFAAS